MTELRLQVSPSEHVRFADAIVTVAGKLRSLLGEGKTLDELHELLEEDAEWPGPTDTGTLALAATLLYALGLVRVDDEGCLRPRSGR